MSFHFNLGQFISLALLGLSAYEQQDAAGSGGPSLFLNPQVTSEYLQGVATIFQAQQTSVASANPPVATAQVMTNSAAAQTHTVTTDPMTGTITVTPIASGGAA